MRGDEFNSIEIHVKINRTYIALVSANSFTNAGPILIPTLVFHACADLGMGSMSTRNESSVLNCYTIHTEHVGYCSHGAP